MSFLCGPYIIEQVQMFLRAAKMVRQHKHTHPTTQPPTNQPSHHKHSPIETKIQEDYLAILEGKRIAADPSQTPCPTPGCLGALSKKEGARGKPVACSKCGKVHVLGKKTREDEALDRLAARSVSWVC